MQGAGKYDELCTLVRQRARARGTMVIIIGGNKGHGFASQVNEVDMGSVPKMLRSIADQVEKDHAHILAGMNEQNKKIKG